MNIIMNKKKEFVKNTAILTFGKICTQFISFFLLPLYTSILEPSEYGSVDLIMTYVSLLIPVVCLQLDQGIFRYLLNIRNDKGRIIELFSSVLLIILLTTTAFFLFSIPIYYFINNSYYLFLVFGVITAIYSNLFMQFSRGLGKITNYSIGSFLTASVTVILNVLFLAVLRIGPVGLFLSTIFANIVNVIYLLISSKIYSFIVFDKFNKKTAKEVISYSLPFIPNQLSGWVLSVSDRTIISKFLSLSSTGIYSISNKISSAVQTFYSFINTAWVESVSLYYDKNDKDCYITDMIQTILSMFCSACIMIIALFPFVFDLLINDKYSEAYFHIPILLLGVFFQVILGLCSGIYIALKKSSTIAKTTLVGAVINVLFNLLLIKKIGLYAASLSTLLSYMIVAIYRLIDVKKYIFLHIKPTFSLYIIIAFVISMSFYYIDKPILNVFNVIICLIFSVFLNKKLLISIYYEINKRKKRS